MFLTEAIHYLIFLLLLSSAAFLNFTRNDQYDYYFTKGITGNYFFIVFSLKIQMDLMVELLHQVLQFNFLKLCLEIKFLNGCKTL